MLFSFGKTHFKYLILAQTLYLSQVMSQRQIIWSSLCVLTLLTFFVLIPIDTYSRHSFFYSAAGGVLFFITLFLALGDFDSIYEIIDKVPPGTPQTAARKLSPVAVIPGIILIFILLFYHMSRKSAELEAHGVMTKGRVTGGESKKTTRRFQTTTSYSVTLVYQDSLNHSHIVEASVDGGEFKNLYEGAIVDVVYSRKHPALAKPVFDYDELVKYKKVPNEKLHINHLLAILDESIAKDSVLQYLNGINYEWQQSEDNLYVNEKLNFAVKVFPEAGQLVYVEQTGLFSAADSDFMTDLPKQGFKPSETTVDGKTKLLFDNDKYIITTERETSDRQTGDELFSQTVSTIYHVLRKESSNP
jgi:hypothetical protein